MVPRQPKQKLHPGVAVEGLGNSVSSDLVERTFQDQRGLTGAAIVG